MLLGAVDGLVLGIILGDADGIELNDGANDTDGANDSRQQVLQQFAMTSGNSHLLPIFDVAHAQSTFLLTAAT